MRQSTKDNTMTLADFQALLDAHGSNRQHWPDDRADAAEALLTRSPAARDMLAEARRLDALLAQMAAPAVPDRLMDRLMAVPDAHTQDRARAARSKSGLSLRFLFPRLVGVAASALAIGFIMGSTNVVPAETGLQIAVLDPGAIETVDLSDWAFPEGDDEAAL